MSRWFRHYAGMMSDPKFGGVARFCGRSRAEVLFVFGSLLESASEYDSAVYSWDADAMAELLNIDTPHAQAIHDALEAKGLIAGGQIAAWDKRQFTSDDSSERVRKHRERKRNGDVTLQPDAVTPPDTEADTDTTAVTNVPAVVRSEVAPTPRKSKRCPESFYPSDDDLKVAAEEGFSPGEINRELAKIRDHQFRDAHSDWGAVFRGWIRRAADRKPKLVTQNGQSPSSAKLAAKQANMERALRGAALAADRRPY